MSEPKAKRWVGKYEVGRTIGEPTFAKLRFAQDSETREPVALMILDKEKVLKHKMAEQVILFLNWLPVFLCWLLKTRFSDRSILMQVIPVCVYR